MEIDIQINLEVNCGVLAGRQERDDFSPPPGMLPETGFSTFAVPESLADIGLTAMGLAVVCGIALGGVAGVYRWRKSR